MWEPSQQRGQGNPHLNARQMLAEALVDAETETQVTARLPTNVEGVGVGKPVRIAVGRLN